MDETNYGQVQKQTLKRTGRDAASSTPSPTTVDDWGVQQKVVRLMCFPYTASLTDTAKDSLLDGPLA